MNIKKPDSPIFSKRSLPEILLRWILSNIKGTPEHLEKDIKKHKKY